MSRRALRTYILKLASFFLGTLSVLVIAIVLAPTAYAQASGSALDTDGNIVFSIYPKTSPSTPGTIKFTTGGNVTLGALADCPNGSTVVGNNGNLTCTTPPGGATPVSAITTGDITGFDAYNNLIYQGVHILWGTDTVDLNNMLFGCQWNATNEQPANAGKFYNSLITSSGCQIALCTGAFGKPPVLYAVEGTCGPYDLTSPHCESETSAAGMPGAPIINKSCFYNN